MNITIADLNTLPIPESLTAFAMRDANRLRKELVTGAYIAEKDGAYYWSSNDAPVPASVFRDAFVVPPAGQSQAEADYCSRVLSDFQDNVVAPSEEELFEMRAAYGPGATVVNVITGRRTYL